MMDMNERKKHIEYALRGLPISEQRELAQFAINVYKQSTKVEARKLIGTFKPGEKVYFTGKKGQKYTVTIEAIMSKNIIGRDIESGKLWRFPAYIANKLEG